MTTAAQPENVADSGHARLARYALWQVRDYLRERGAATMILTLLFGALGVYTMRNAVGEQLARLSAADVAAYGGLAAARAAIMRGASATFVAGFVGAVTFLAALLAMNGMIANDRKLGYYRFLFSKPLSPTRYYVQGFAVNAASYLVLFSLLALVYGAYMTPVLTPSFLGGVAAVFLMYSAVSFLCSAAARWDWLSLVAVTVAAKLLWGMFGHSRHPLAVLLYLLPPVDRTDEIYQAVAAGTPLPARTMAWVCAYGAVCFVAALLLLRRRRLAII